MLTRLSVNNFRTFRNFELKFKPLTLLVGRNGSGKTAVFDVLEKLRRLAIDGESCESVFQARDFPAWFDGAGEQTFEVEFSSDVGLIRYQLHIGFDSRRRAKIVYESEYWNGKPLFETTDNGLRIPGLLEENSGFLSGWPSNKCFLNWRGLSYPEKFPSAFQHLSTIFVSSPSPVRNVGFAIEEVERPDKSLSNFVGWVRHLSQEVPAVIPRITEHLQGLLHGFESLGLEKSGDARFLKFEFFRQDDAVPDPRQYRLAYDQLSDGQRQLVMLYTLLEGVVAEGMVLCLDEPENFLALREIQPWIRALENAVEESGGQCILASHHPEIIDRLDLANTVLLARNGSGVTRIHPFPTDVIGDDMLTASEVMARSWDEP